MIIYFDFLYSLYIDALKKRHLFYYMFSSISTKFTSFQTTHSFHKDNTVTIKRNKIKILGLNLIQAAYS